ncbi:MAG: hypothetical protein QM673_12660 [Gordonia sp. (in: high G+C Gram-positive bacteria)]
MTDTEFDYTDTEFDRTDTWLSEASRQLREPGSDVNRLISSITANLARLRRPARALATDDDRIMVSDRVLKQLLATRIRERLDRLVVLVALDGTHHELTRIRIGLIARYHDDLLADAETVRTEVASVLSGVLGPQIAESVPERIDVGWQDLHTRE